MMRLILTLFLGIFFLQPGLVQAQDSLYFQVKDISQQALFSQSVEEASKKFLSQVFPEQAGSISSDQVDDTLKGYSVICSNNEQEEAASGNKVKTYLRCRELVDMLVRSILTSLQRTRTLGRDLQLLATTFERGMLGITSTKQTLALRLQSILNIWQSGIDATRNPLAKDNLRYEPLPDSIQTAKDDIDQALQQLIEQVEPADEPSGEEAETEVPGLNREQYIAAVWRYRDGYKSVRRSLGLDPAARCDRANEEADGTELQNIRKVWCSVEDAFDHLDDLVQTHLATLTPPPAAGEVVIFPPIALSNNLIVWVRSDDIGVAFDFPIEPVLPALDCTQSRHPEDCLNNAILGGNYPSPPPEPEVNVGLCSHPLAGRGYLCRPISDATLCSNQDQSTDGSEQTQQSIRLTECRSPPLQNDRLVRGTESGPDLCQIGGWQKHVPDDQLTLPERFEQCSHCRIRFECRADCGPVGNAFTHKKNSDGVIKICLPSQIPGGSDGALQYLALHEMIHAQQFCNDPLLDAAAPETKPETVQQCCGREYEAYQIQCAAMQQDGILTAANVDIETCAALGADISCATFATSPAQRVCSTIDTETSQKSLEDIKQAFEDLTEPLNLPTQCSQLVSDLNAYLAGETARGEVIDHRIINTIESVPRVCSPACPVRFDNTIGNNLCYLGQCIEQGIEEFRIFPGRSPLTVGDEAYPWDSCLLPEPIPVNPVTVPSRPKTKLPLYNPAALVHELDVALCQVNGLPPLTPPVLCNSDLERRFAQPLNTPDAMAESLRSQINENELAMQSIERITNQISLRIGGQLFADYFAQPWNYLAELINAASDLLQRMMETKFPQAMCPRDNPEDFCQALTTVPAP